MIIDVPYIHHDCVLQILQKLNKSVNILFAQVIFAIW